MKQNNGVWKLFIKLDTITSVPLFEAESKSESLKTRLGHNYQASLYLYST